ncbi:MAG: transglutaminase-like domain-containing protein [Thermoanaerobaculia bacterium]
MRNFTLLALSLFAAVASFAATSNTYDATYTATVSAIPEGTKNLEVWIPLPMTRGAQTVSDVQIESPYTFTRHTDPMFGNEYAFAKIENPPAGDLAIKVHFIATRREITEDHPFETAATKSELKHALQADHMVTLSPRVKKLAAEVTAGKSGTVDQAHAIFEHLVTTMKYDKTIPGWGNGDTERACDIKAGNCTDFHSLFMSLARAKGIPARFVIGFPLTAADGQVKGYHCWAEFWVKGKGWIPVDASDASKLSDNAKREYLFGNLDPNRVQFTVGRDLTLTPRTSEPLNFFIYPRAESNGKPIGTPAVSLQFKPLPQSASR